MFVLLTSNIEYIFKISERKKVGGKFAIGSLLLSSALFRQTAISFYKMTHGGLKSAKIVSGII